MGLAPASPTSYIYSYLRFQGRKRTLMPKKKILIVDDDEDIRQSLRECLEAEGFEAVDLSNGALALAYLSSMPAPDVILLDLRMPVLNGRELCERLHEDPRLVSIPVVVMSADRLGPETSEELGASRCIAKPLDLNLLLSGLQECCAG
jgi:CheY-like chemotaxis protein